MKTIAFSSAAWRVRAFAFSALAVGFAAVAAETNPSLSAGFGRVDVTPPLGTELAGYFHKRVSDGVLDNLYASATAFSDGTNRAVVMSVDVINLRGYFDLYRQHVARAAGLDPSAVFIACTHTHTGPVVGASNYGEKLPNFDKASVYEKFMAERLADAARLALADLAPAKISIGRGAARDISFVRRFRMKDGTCRTNPGRNNPDVVAPIGEPDEELQVVRIDRAGKDSIMVVNFQCHPDTIGGNKISADWPGEVRRVVERSLDGVKCMFINGAQGDTNHHCLDPVKSKIVPRGRDVVYHHMGNVVAGAAIGTWTACVPVSPRTVRFGVAAAHVKSNRAPASAVPRAKEIVALNAAGKMNEIPGVGMEKITACAEARRIISLSDGPDFFDLPLSAVALGEDVAFVGFPGEPFTAYGKQVKRGSPFAMTVPACIVNGNYGYLPTDDAFRLGGYEARGSLFVEGFEKAMVDGHLAQLRRLFAK